MQTETQTETPPIRIAFLGYMELEKGAAYRGGILVVDEWGKPLEFRCTAPVRPNPVQRTLYGETLMPHIAVELVGAPILRTVEEKPLVVVIQDEVFFDLRNHTETPLVRIRRQGTQVKMTGSDESKKSASIVIDSTTGKFQPVILEAHRQFPNDLAAWREKLSQLFGRWDLIEPFDRLAKALDYVHQEKVLEGPF
jgi:hypothetical protein